MSSDNYSGQYTWNLNEFLECKVKERKTADTFSINELPFTLEAYPNVKLVLFISSFMYIVNDSFMLQYTG